MPQSDFLRAVERSGGLLQKAQNELEQTKRLAGAPMNRPSPSPPGQSS